MLRVLRHRARLTQRELGLAVGYSEAQISRLEKGKRLPDPSVVAALFLPSLGLANEPELATRLHLLAEKARTSSHTTATPMGSENHEVGAVSPAMADDLADVPVPPQPNVYRAAEAAELARLLTAQRCVLIVGPPGTGKTSLAADAARQQGQASGICWLTFTAGITTPVEAVIRRLARFLARHGETEVMPLLDLSKTEHPLPRDEQLHLITTALGRARPLICLDNAQLLRAEPETMAVIGHLAAAPGARFPRAEPRRAAAGRVRGAPSGGTGQRRGTYTHPAGSRGHTAWPARGTPDRPDGGQPDADPPRPGPGAGGRSGSGGAVRISSTRRR
jgi:DNA-binding XRE family transcriptional regulator